MSCWASMQLLADGDKSVAAEQGGHCIYAAAWTHDISLENVTWLCMAHLIHDMHAWPSFGVY